jgi:hypothetical protein
MFAAHSPMSEISASSIQTAQPSKTTPLIPIEIIAVIRHTHSLYQNSMFAKHESK